MTAYGQMEMRNHQTPEMQNGGATCMNGMNAWIPQ